MVFLDLTINAEHNDKAGIEDIKTFYASLVSDQGIFIICWKTKKLTDAGNRRRRAASGS